MNLHTNDQSQAKIVQRIDAIIAELQALRQQVQKAPHSTTSPANLVDELAGALGNGRWQEYDGLLDWERFDE
jgi:hypothetical protein